MSESLGGAAVPPEPTLDRAPQGAPSPRKAWVPLVLGASVVALLLAGAALLKRAQSGVNQVSLSSDPKPVTAVEARSATFRATRRYVATLEPWLEARVGPQIISAYVDAVLFRPGASVKKGEVLATLDCRNASAQSQGVAMLARSIEAKQAALEREAARVGGMLDGGFVSQNEVERKRAESDSERAELLAARAKLLGTQIQVNDCVLKAPFDGEVSGRLMDPGAFARPGSPIVELVDRSTVRVVADVPEADFDVVKPGTPVSITVLARGKTLTANVTRRSPAADASTRTVRFEIDLPDPTREIPVGTTAELTVEVGEPQAASEIPLTAASVRGGKATVYSVEGDAAHKLSVAVLGERAGTLFINPAGLKPGSRVVTEGRGSLSDGDKVRAKLEGEKGSIIPAAHKGEAVR